VNGWIAVSRRVFAHEALRRGPLCDVAAWLELVARANYEANPAHDPPLDRGEACVTAGRLADAWSWERGEVRNALARWERAGMISSRSVGRATIVRVLNYDAFQAPIHAPTVRQPCAKRAPTEPSNSSDLQGKSANDAPTMRQPCATITEQENKRTKEQEIKTIRALPVVAAGAAPVTDEGKGEKVATAVDLSTKAGRSRAYPPLSSLPRSGTRYEYPPAYVAFRDAYPDAARRAPAPATYQDWRALVVGGVDPDTLERAARAHAIESGGKFARRCHGPSGWLRAGDWEGYASGPARRPNPVSEQIAESPLQVASVTPIAPLPETGCSQWAAIRDRLSATVPPLAPSLRACVGEVDGETLRLRTRDEMAVLVLRGKLPTWAPDLKFDLRLVEGS